MEFTKNECKRWAVQFESKLGLKAPASQCSPSSASKVSVYPFVKFLICLLIFECSGLFLWEWHSLLWSSFLQALLQCTPGLIPNLWRTKLIAPAPSFECDTAWNTASSTVCKPEWVSFVARCQIRAVITSFWFWVPPWRQRVRRFLSLRFSKFPGWHQQQPWKEDGYAGNQMFRCLDPSDSNSIWTKVMVRIAIGWLEVMSAMTAFSMSWMLWVLSLIVLS